jgi:hypothetical protein
MKMRCSRQFQRQRNHATAVKPGAFRSMRNSWRKPEARFPFLCGAGALARVVWMIKVKSRGRGARATLVWTFVWRDCEHLEIPVPRFLQFQSTVRLWTPRARLDSQAHWRVCFIMKMNDMGLRRLAAHVQRLPTVPKTREHDMQDPASDFRFTCDN